MVSEGEAHKKSFGTLLVNKPRNNQYPVGLTAGSSIRAVQSLQL